MQRTYSPFLLFLVTIFFIRALLPTGFMPDVSGQHLLAICSGDSLITIAVDENNQPIPDKSPQHLNTEHCPFAPFSSALLSNHHADDYLIPAPLIASRIMVLIIAGHILPLSLDGQHLTRAPPSLS